MRASTSQLGQRRYRITRTLRRNKAAKVIFEDVSNGDGILVADKVADANQAVERLLGVGYEGFSQSVILPQGQFDRFLRSQGGARRAVLTELLRLERYERMRRLAVQSKDKTAVEVQSFERQLGDYGQATPDAVETMRASVAAADEALRLRGDARVAVEATAAHLRAGRQMTRELEENEASLRKLVAVEADIELERRRIVANRRAEPLLPVIQAASEAKRRAGEAQTVLAGINNEAQVRKRALDQAAGSVDAATNGAKAIPAMRERIQALDRLHGTVAHVRQVRTKVGGLKKKSLEAAEAVRLGKLAVTGLVLARDEQHRATETARANRAAITFDASLYAVLEPLLVEASTAQTIDFDVTKRKQGVEKALEVAVAAEGAALDVEGQLNDSRSALVERQRQLHDVEHELEHARTSHMASELRGTLRPGDACPVYAGLPRFLPLKRQRS